MEEKTGTHQEIEMDEEIRLETQGENTSGTIRIRTERVLIKCVDGTLVNGETNLGRATRVSDLFTRGENPFIVVFNAHVHGYTGDVVFVNRDHIVWAMPLDAKSTVI